MGSELLSARLFLHRLAAKTPAGERRWLLAVSGGRDSMCLLHLTLQWSRENGVFQHRAQQRQRQEQPHPHGHREDEYAVRDGGHLPRQHRQIRLRDGDQHA